MKYREEAERLLNAGTEEEVHQILQEPFYDDKNWRPLGQEDNNYGVVENQAASPMAALTEVVVNSIDAILLKNYREKYEDANKSPSFPTMEAAVEDLVNKSQERLTLAADGEKSSPISLQIEDSGEGQPNEEFEETFLGLLQPGSLKQEYEFLQGQYGMGSSGVLPFCGDRGYKFIVSSSHEKPGEWSWSLIRKNEEKTRYEYFTADGEIPSFKGELNGEEYGSIVKLYNYDISSRSNISSSRNLRRYLERYLIESPLPIRLEERRDYKSHQMSAVSNGALPHIQEKLSHLVESHHKFEYSFDNSALGTREIEVVLFENDDELSKKEKRRKRLFVGGEKHRSQAIFFTVNGQTHGDLGKSFIKNRCSRPRVAGDTLIFVDFSDIKGANLVNLFKPARDRLTDKQIAKDLISGLENAVSSDEILQNEESLRRQEAVEHSDEEFENQFKQVLADTPSLREYFVGEEDTDDGSEEPSARPGIDYDEIEFNPPYIPNEFNPIETFRSRVDYDVFDKEGIFEVDVPLEGSSRIRFELNAPDNYLYRDDSVGQVKVTPDEVLQSQQLHHGVLSLEVTPLPGSREGTELPVTVEVERPTSEPLSNTLRLICVEQETDEDDQNDDELALEAPQVVEVNESEWDQHNFTKDDVVRIDDYTDEGGGLSIFVNMDCVQIDGFVESESLDAAEESEVEAAFKQGVVVYSLSQYIEFKEQQRLANQSEEDDEEISEEQHRIANSETDLTELVAQSMRGIARTLPSQYFRLKELE